MLHRIPLSFALLAVALVAPAARADTLFVDAGAPCPGSGTAGDPFCAIQAAVDAAADGDEVLVAAGTYAENVAIAGKRITLAAQRGAALTIIAGVGDAPAVSITGAAADGSVLDGFTITGGRGAVLASGPFATLGGAGVFCDGAAATIRRNVVTGNVFGHATKSIGEALGGGVYVRGAAAVLRRNTIRDNGGATCGGGVYFTDEAPASGGEIVANVVEDHQATSVGGGVAIVGASPLVAGNTIRGNVASAGAGLACTDGAGPLIRDNVIADNFTDEDEGGGVLLALAQAELRDNTITGNSCLTAGGGVAVLGGDVELVGNLIQDNLSASEGGGVWIGGAATLIGNEIAQNVAVGRGAGILADANPTGSHIARNVIRDHELASAVIVEGLAVVPHVLADNLIVRNGSGIDVLAGAGGARLLRNTILDNQWDGVFVDGGGFAEVASCIVRDNGPDPEFEVFATAFGIASVNWCNVRGGGLGAGNIDADPLFVDAGAGDYRLGAGSPCIDAGQPADVTCGLDLPGMPRRLDGLLDGGLRVDMGAHEFGHVALEAELSPGTLSIGTTGTPGLPVFMVFALEPDLACVSGYGALLFDLAAPWSLVSWGANPTLQVLPLPPAIPVPSVTLQALVLTGGGAAGTLSNAVEVVFP